MRNAMRVGCWALGIGRFALVFSGPLWPGSFAPSIASWRHGATLLRSIPGTTIRTSQYAAMPPWFRDITPDNPEEDSDCKLPELHENEPLPLAYWEGLLYALTAEIRYLYQDLKLHFGVRRFERATSLHLTTARRQNDPFSAVDFARLLETCWEKIMSPQLRTALDYAIHWHVGWLLKIVASFVADGETPAFYSMIRFQGLHDVTSMDPV